MFTSIMFKAAKLKVLAGLRVPVILPVCGKGSHRQVSVEERLNQILDCDPVLQLSDARACPRLINPQILMHS